MTHQATDQSFSSSYDVATGVLSVAGDVDEISGPTLREAVNEYSAGFSRDLDGDLSDVTFLPSLAIGVLAVAMKSARENGTSFELVASEGSLAQRVLTICALPHRTS